jgi:DNA-binding response OmpR family regulator
LSHALIIEDELLLAFAVEEALRELGYTTFEIARSVRDAVNAAERQCPDLIVANHHIIDGTGTDAVLSICSGKAIPVVFVTGSGPEIRLRLPDALIVEKPLSQSRLGDAVLKARENPFEHSHDSPDRSNLN